MVANRIAIEPLSAPSLEAAIRVAGAQPCRLDSSVSGLVWNDYSRPQLLSDTLAANPQLEWVQLPYAGVDAFADIIARPIRFTSAKGAYAEPVAEHALALCLALGRAIPQRVRAREWGEKFAASLYDSTVLVIGAGGIAQEFLRLVQPFRAKTIVVRNGSQPLQLASETHELASLSELLPLADFVVVAAALTPQTVGLINAANLKLMKPSAYLVNIARGAHVVLPDLLVALRDSQIAGAALDVTDPEPLPAGHPAWDEPKLIITPHTADTPEQVEVLLAARVEANAKAFLGKGPWIGEVSKTLGY